MLVLPGETLPTLTDLATAYVAAREARLALDAQAAEAAKVERDAKAALTAQMLVEGATQYGIPGATFRLQAKVRYQAKDWGAVWKFIVENEAFDLVHKRLTDTALRLREEDGITVPGIERSEYYDLSVGSGPRGD